MKSHMLSGRETPRFAGVKTFFRLPVTSLEGAFEAGIFGIPYDGAVSYRPGARFAPVAAREASSMGRGYSPERASSWVDRLHAVDLGDCPVNPLSQEETLARIEAFWLRVVSNGRRGIAVGGDHSTTLGSLRAMRKAAGRPVGLVHFDAHLDTYPAAWGAEYHHGAFLRHALEEGLVEPSSTVQIGLRGPLVDDHDFDVVRKFGVRSTTVDDLREKGYKDYMASLALDAALPHYISFDIDCLDPAYAPGTGTPVPGGLSTYEALQVLRRLSIPNLIGADLVEISPPYDHADITALAGVAVLNEFLHIMGLQTR